MVRRWPVFRIEFGALMPLGRLEVFPPHDWIGLMYVHAPFPFYYFGFAGGTLARRPDVVHFAVMGVLALSDHDRPCSSRVCDGCCFIRAFTDAFLIDRGRIPHHFLSGHPAQHSDGGFSACEPRPMHLNPLIWRSVPGREDARCMRGISGLLTYSRWKSC